MQCHLEKFTISTEQRLCFESTIIFVFFGHKEFIKKHIKYATSQQNTKTEKVTMPYLFQ